MSLSTGTRNLKFMQRAAARNSLNGSTASPANSSTPSRPSPLNAGASTPVQVDATPVKGSNAYGALDGVQGDGTTTPIAPPSTILSADGDVVILTKEEKEAMWVLPARTRPAGNATGSNGLGGGRGQAHAGPSSGRRFIFEQSYMPFMLDTEADDPVTSTQDDGDVEVTSHYGSNTAQASTSTSAGGGRMAFGNFGQAAKDADAPSGDAYGSDEYEGDDKTRGNRKGGGAGYMQPTKSGQGQGARGKKRGSDMQANATPNVHERDREESRQAKIRKMAQDRVKREPVHEGPVGGFMRPSNYDPTLSKPSSSGPSAPETKPKLSTADRLRNIASSRPSSSTSTPTLTSQPRATAAHAGARDIKPVLSNASSPAPSTGSAHSGTGKKSKKRTSLNTGEGSVHPKAGGEGGVKRVKTETKEPSQSRTTSAATSAASTPSATPTGTASAGASMGTSIDERERQIKAQKKKDKKARQKARESGAAE